MVQLGDAAGTASTYAEETYPAREERRRWTDDGEARRARSRLRGTRRDRAVRRADDRCLAKRRSALYDRDRRRPWRDRSGGTGGAAVRLRGASQRLSQANRTAPM